MEENCARQLQELKVSLCNLHTHKFFGLPNSLCLKLQSKYLGKALVHLEHFQRRWEATISNVQNDMHVSYSYESTQINLKMWTIAVHFKLINSVH